MQNGSFSTRIAIIFNLFMRIILIFFLLGCKCSRAMQLFLWENAVWSAHILYFTLIFPGASF